MTFTIGKHAFSREEIRVLYAMAADLAAGIEVHGLEGTEEARRFTQMTCDAAGFTTQQREALAMLGAVARQHTSNEREIAWAVEIALHAMTFAGDQR